MKKLLFFITIFTVLSCTSDGNNPEDVVEDVKDALIDALDAMKNVIMAPMKGIDEMIDDFEKLMCLCWKAVHHYPGGLGHW